MAVELPFAQVRSTADSFTRTYSDAVTNTQAARNVFNFTYQAIVAEMVDIDALISKIKFLTYAYGVKLGEANTEMTNLNNASTFLSKALKNNPTPEQKAQLQTATTDLTPKLLTARANQSDYQLIIAQLNRMMFRNTAKRNQLRNTLLQYGTLINCQDAMNGNLLRRYQIISTVYQYLKQMKDADEAGAERIDSNFANFLFQISNNMDIQWASEFNSSSIPVFSGTIDFHDIDQGRYGDCQLLALLMGIARINPDSIQNAITVVGDGKYLVRLYKPDGTIDFVSVTDSELGASNASQASERWVAIMERAYDHSSGVIPGDPEPDLEGLAEQDVADMYRAITGRDAFTENIASLSAQQKFDYLRLHLGAGHMVKVHIHSSAFGETGFVPRPAPEWYVDHHAYSIVGVQDNMIQIRNPWGDSAPGAIDGVFNVSIDDFNRIFNTEVVVGT